MRSMRWSLVVFIIVKASIAGGKGDRGKQRIFRLTGIEPRVLHDDRLIGFDDTRVRRSGRNRLRFGEIVETKMAGPAGRHLEPKRTRRVAILVEDREGQVSRAVARIDHAKSL